VPVIGSHDHFIGIDMGSYMRIGFSGKLSVEIAKVNGITGFLMKPVVKTDMAKMVCKVPDQFMGKVKECGYYVAPHSKVRRNSRV
jgi:hypothetical protein